MRTDGCPRYRHLECPGDPLEPRAPHLLQHPLRHLYVLGHTDLAVSGDGFREQAEGLVAVAGGVTVDEDALARGYKQLEVGDRKRAVMPVHEAGGKIKVARADAEVARKELGAALTDRTDEAAETLGHVDYKYYLDRYSDWLAEQGEVQEAKSVQSGLLQTLSARKVLDRVLKNIEARGAAYA